MKPQEFFDLNGLWDLGKLKQFAQDNSVYCIQSPKYPNLVMLHYLDDCQWNNIWTEFSLMSRGLIVDLETKVIVAHPFNKFFNMGQVPETSYENLKGKIPFEVSEKLDGSMIIVFRNPRTGELATTSKGSFDSQHGAYALQFLPEVLKTCGNLVDNYTFIFELISPKFQIVIDYKKKVGYPEGLYLIGIRDKTSEEDWSYSSVQKWAETFGVPTFKRYKFDSLDSLIETSKTLPVLEEGYVIRFNDGLRVKIKGPEYLRVHKFLSKLSDKYLIEALISGDDKILIDLAPEEYRQDIVDKIALYVKIKGETITECDALLTRAEKGTRKEFAFWVRANVRKPLWAFMFNVYDNKQLKDAELFRWIGEQEKVSATTRI